MTESEQSGIGRRRAIGVLAAGAAALSAALPEGASAATGNAALEQAFRDAFAAAPDKPAAMASARLAFLATGALVVDHDVPFPLDRDAYASHLAFHAASWERIETRFNDLRSTIHGGTGIVSAYFIQRGKPRGAGFRLRAGYCTAVCALDGGVWRAIGLHLSPLSAQIIDASPG